jgi:hypothetical protein
LNFQLQGLWREFLILNRFAKSVFLFLTKMEAGHNSVFAYKALQQNRKCSLLCLYSFKGSVLHFFTVFY